VSGGERPIIPRQVGDALAAGLARDPDHEAVIGSDGRLTYCELDQAINHAASMLHTLGVRAHDTVAISLPNRAELVVLFYAVMRLGAVFVGINRGLAPPEKSYILNDARARILIANPDVGEEVAALSTVRVVAVDDTETDGWRDRGPTPPQRYPRALCHPDQVAGLAYTSGTTGRPKGVVHSHRNLLLPGAALAAARGYGPALRRGDCAALTILNLQVTSTLLVAQSGGTQVVMDRVDPVGIAKWIRKERVNSWFGVPTMLHGLATSDEVAVADLATLTDVWTGGSDISPAIRRAFENKFGIQIHATYGMTEVPTVVTIEPRHVPPVPGSSGRQLPHLLTEIRGEDGHILPAGATGEITVRARTDGPWGGTYRPMLGYWEQPAASAETVRHDVLHTGDIGSLDESGNLFVRDRRRSLILRGGANVYPAEVERVLLEVDGVLGAAVVPIPDDRLGQRVAAVVELVPDCKVTVEDLESHCRRNLARYKVPERWRIEVLPRNAMGKVIRTSVENLFA
jgi:acyl-CoA synthetase (AMP-forming)/AMP-acid ligase II